jgi:hypothetical protein
MILQILNTFRSLYALFDMNNNVGRQIQVQNFFYFLGRRYLALNVWRFSHLRRVHKYLFNLVYKFKTNSSPNPNFDSKTAIHGKSGVSNCYQELSRIGYCQLDPSVAHNLINLHQEVVNKAKSLLFDPSSTIAGSSKFYLQKMHDVPLADLE